MAAKKVPNKKTVSYSSGKGLTVRLRGKRISKGVTSLYLEYYQGYSRDAAGNIKTKKKTETLKIYITDNPKSSDERRKNDESITLAQQIRSKRESDLQYGSFGLVAPYRRKSNFFDYCEAYVTKYQRKDIRMIKSAIREFKAFTKATFLTPQQIDQGMVRGFKDYLEAKYNGETPRSFFARFKKILNAAVEDGLFARSPAEKITCKAPTGIPKEILMPEEIIRLSKTPSGNSDVKRAFLLSLNTGLRFVDIEDLRYKHVTNGQIKKQQQKTGREVTIDLNPAAIKLIGDIGNPEDLIFKLPSFTACLSSIRTWAKKCGINKKITWHSARHSFATILLMNRTDIKTVGNLLGHSKLEHTQKYTHIVDSLKAQAVNTLPDIEI